MLILKRKLGELVIINNGDVVITVIDIYAGAVRLGFQADQHIQINREEVQADIEKARQAIAKQNAEPDAPPTAKEKE